MLTMKDAKVKTVHDDVPAHMKPLYDAVLATLGNATAQQALDVLVNLTATTAIATGNHETIVDALRVCVLGQMEDIAAAQSKGG